MRIVYWNIRAGGGRRAEAIGEQLIRWAPDVIGLCEFRGTPASQLLAETLFEKGWPHQLMAINTENLAVNAVMLASRWPLRRIGIHNRPPEPHRWLFARVDRGVDCGVDGDLAVGVMHAPNFVTGRKRPFFDAIRDFAGRWRGGPAIIGGDTNTGVPPLDGNPSAFHPWEVDWVHELSARGWPDAYRQLHGDTLAHTWYSPNAGNGYRLDQAYLNQRLLPALNGARYEWGTDENLGTKRHVLSDHAALIVDLA